VSLFEIKAARALLRTQGRQRIAQYEVFQAIETQRKVVDDARTKTRDVRRSMARRPPAGAAPASQTPSAGKVHDFS
jgi:hypothetical protein